MITFSKLGKAGQLGNQLFQYALLRAVATKRGFEMRIPKKFDGVKKKDLVELAPFQIESEELPAGAKFPNNYKEAHYNFDPKVFEQPDGCDFEGYFQTEKYFADIAPQIRKEFTFLPSIAEPAAAHVAGLRRVDNAPIVSVHVRRGDYLDDADLFTVLTADWYKAAMQSLQQDCLAAGVGHPKFLIFSNDIPWCRTNLSAVPPIATADILFCEGSSHWFDLAAMSLCDHNVISASSFSWWAAWLNANPAKKVLAPTPWFQPKMKANICDVLPESWMTLPETAKAG